MITYSNGGRLGNQLFQYVIARLLAERLGYKLATNYNWNDTLTVTPAKTGIAYPNDTVVIKETNETPCLFDMPFEKRHYHLQGFWQCSDYYVPNRDKIKKYFNERAPLNPNPDDIVMHVRLDDYKRFGRGGNVLNPAYYLQCIEREKFNKLYIVTDSIGDSYFNTFNKYKPIFNAKSEKEDFWFLTKFDRIILGNSTFSWWAAFLSNASKIYSPSCWIRNSVDIPHRLQRLQNTIIMPAGFIDYSTPDIPPPKIELSEAYKRGPQPIMISMHTPIQEQKKQEPERIYQPIQTPLFDIFLACAPKDFNKLPYSFKSIEDHVDGYRDIYICTPVDVPQGTKDKLSQSVRYIRDEEGLPRVNRDGWAYRPNWSFQQHLKLFQKITRDWYLTIDCDTIINQDMAFFEGAKPVWWCGHEQYHEAYFKFQKEMIGIGKIAPFSFIADMNLIYRPIIDDMLKKNNHTIKTFVRQSQRIIGPDCWIGEPELYGSYFFKNYPDMYSIKPMKQAPFDGRLQDDPTSFVWTDEEIRKRIDDMKKSDFHTFSMHSWFKERGIL